MIVLRSITPPVALTSWGGVRIPEFTLRSIEAELWIDGQPDRRIRILLEEPLEILGTTIVELRDFTIRDTADAIAVLRRERP